VGLPVILHPRLKPKRTAEGLKRPKIAFSGPFGLQPGMQTGRFFSTVYPLWKLLNSLKIPKNFFVELHRRAQNEPIDRHPWGEAISGPNKIFLGKIMKNKVF
jgi:hypothetical protein